MVVHWGKELSLTARRERVWSVATVFARLALAAGFLSAVADRFGIWGPPHTGAVGWGDFATYTAYTHTLSPYLPDMFQGAAAWAATAAETVLGLTLLAGILVRWSALAATALLLGFALSMGLFLGWEAPLSNSVPAAAAAALLLALAPVDRFAFSVDGMFARKRSQVAGRLLAVAALAGVTACSPATQTTPVAATTAASTPPQVNVLLQQALPNAEGKTFTSQIVDFPPGAAAPPHRHGQAFVYAYVLAGDVRSQVDDNPATTFHPGENWFEKPGAHHVVAANPSATERAKLLVVYVSTTGDALQANDPHS
ncbi:cupin domain-containing protein [Kutzneria chonburiensis]|uniref:Cupin domain-containing protein n=1 Tax=Kutzneria chonburiensis TaxID=1483604 RepID=A0ABV6MP21_9PSEU|nr:cupin domain-containing protein [Kutzneria chonburiensis]